MDKEKELVWKRLKEVRRGKYVSPGVSVNVVDVSIVIPPNARPGDFEIRDIDGKKIM